ncbi:fructose-bisphosphate aldolase [Pseudomonas sp. 3JA]|uniref:fructose-bisphosphate aldolase n=1 Tax=Pseudomonas sp. 3JA TaxID=3109347 RepID=UPI0030098078
MGDLRVCRVPSYPRSANPHAATTHPVLLIDTQAPLPELHACASERLHATLDYLTLVACTSLSDSASSDINTITNVARILVQDVADVFGVIERRGLEG